MTEPELQELAWLAIKGGGRASYELIERLWPLWLRQVRGAPALRAMAGTDDDVTNIVVRLVEKLSPPDGRSLSSYPAWQRKNPDKAFEDWIRIVTANAVRDYVRELKRSPDCSTSLDDERISPQRILNEYLRSSVSGALSVRPPFTAKETARKLLEHARAWLREEQWSALRLWLAGSSFLEIAEGERCTSDEARKRVRSALALLRRQFSPESSARIE